jgi:asparagine synthase (glutamine-hydrolysing)
MPGIVGLITRMPREAAEAQLNCMLKSMQHEPFYTCGTWRDEAAGIYVGWVAIEGSFSASMPLSNDGKDLTLIFSGEDFQDERTLKQFRQQHDHVAADYLPNLYDRQGNFPGSLNGRFHGLLIDRNTNTVTLFNDRYGMHRVYYADSNGSFYFAAEAKAILAVCPKFRSLDANGLAQFLSCGCVLDNGTLFEGIRVLPPASAWICRNGEVVRKGTYFNPKEWENQEPLDAEAYYQEFRRIFSENLARYFRGSSPIGMSITGGLDTRMILAWRQFQTGELPCYSFGGARDCQDVVIGRAVAAACGQSHEVIHVGNEFLSKFPHYAERAVYLTDGCTMVNRGADLYVNERARQIAPVRMTGNYGGEVLRRVRAFKPVIPNGEAFQSDLYSLVENTQRRYDEMVQCHPVSFSLFIQAPWHHFGLLALEQTQLTLRSPFLDNELVRNVYRAPESACSTHDACLRLIADGNERLGRIRTDMGVAVNGHFSARLLRAAMKFTFKAEYAYDYGMPQWISRIDHALAPLRLERLFLGRHKFAHFRIWYRDQLASYLREILLDSRSLSRAYVNRQGVENMVHAHTSGARNYTTELHKILTLELLHRLLIDGKPESNYN